MVMGPSEGRADKMKYSIITTVHNRRECLKIFMGGIENLIIPEGCGVEFIIVDNGSTDSPREEFDKIKIRRAVKYLEMPAPTENAVAPTKYAVENSTSEILLMYSPEILIPEDIIVKDIENREKSGADCMVLYVPVYVFNRQATIEYSPSRPFKEYFSGIDLSQQKSVKRLMAETWKDLTAGSVARRTWENIGGYDERFKKWGWFAIDFIQRAEKSGVKIIHAGFVIHFDHDRNENPKAHQEYISILEERDGK